MKVLKDFKTANQVFKAGDELYDDIERLETWVARGFVDVEKFVAGVVTPPPPVTSDPAAPTVTFA